MVQDFSKCRMEYGKDDEGRDVLLKDGKFQVMMEWEKPYMDACIDALKPFGDVLEVGFGLAYSAERIQTYRPKSHTIIEYHPDIAARAREWAKKYPNVTIIEDTWQNALRKLGVFDCIFFDDYPLQSEREMQKMQEESHQSQLLLKQAEKLLKEVEETLPQLKEIKYSIEDLKGLMAEVAFAKKREVVQFIRFLQELQASAQITADQMQQALQVLIDDKKVTRNEVEELLQSVPSKRPETNDRLFVFLRECLALHMRPGSRFSCFLSSPASKYEDGKFFEEIITNPVLDYHEEEITIDVPQHCGYYTGDKALVITITKVI